MRASTTKSALLVGGTAVVGAVVGVRALWNFAELRDIQKRGRTDHLLFGDTSQDSVKLYNWKRSQWPTVRTVMDNREAVKRELSSAIINREIVIVDHQGNIIERPTWAHVGQLIELEKRCLKTIVKQKTIDK